MDQILGLKNGCAKKREAMSNLVSKLNSSKDGVIQKVKSQLL